MICNDLVYFSIDEDCSACIGASQILEGGPYGCYDNYIVELDKTAPFGNGPWVPGCVGLSDVGKTYQVRVTDPKTGNKCWGNIKIEDKLAPKLTCCDVTIPCNASTAPTFAASNQVSVGKGNVPVAILDNQTVSSTFNFSACNGATIQDVNVKLNITHTWIGDLRVTVESPKGTKVVLWANNCSTADNIIATFDDEATCSNLCASFSQGLTLQPIACAGAGTGTTDFLSKFDGENPAGTWKLTVNDNTSGDQGTINAFEVQIAYQTGPGGAVPSPEVSENCQLVNLTYIDSEVNGGCAQGFYKKILRKWTGTDEYGNTGTCQQTINLSIPTLGDLKTPPDYDGIDAPFFYCTSNAYPTPQWIEGQGLQGFPYVSGKPVGCTINWNYEDLVIDVCDGTYKIRRKWTIIDWCIGDGFEENQIIKVVDNVGPTIACPANLTVSTDPFACCATVNLPDVIITDNCSRINNISGMVTTFEPYTGVQTGMYPIGGSLTTFPGNNYWNLDTLAAFGTTNCLPVGTHIVTYVAEDDCGNTSSCTFRLTVRDYQPPVAACDQFTVVAIGTDDPADCYEPANGCSGAGVTWVKASTFDDGSYDNCNNLKFRVQRMAPYSECINGLNAINGHPDCADIFPDFPTEFERAINESDSIKFYCCEVGTTQTVVFRAYQVDVDGNIMVGPDGSPIVNECMVNVSVQDKIKPVCQPPANVTVSCENFDASLWVYGKANVYDNCCLDTTKVYQGQCGLTHTVNYNLFDSLCNKGTITRTFKAYDCHGLTSQCTQRVVVNYNQDYYVKFPNDVIVTVCDGTGTYGEPTFFGKDCELLGVSYEDQVFTVVPDACFKIERVWTIINWCTYNPNLPCISIPNPNPNPITNNPANLPGPTVSACGTLAPWAPTTVKINPTDATATNYCTFWNANANCYTYKQIIKVIDTQDPTIENCPASPVTFCDITPNDPLLWNESYWWDNVIGQHDLCEGPSDLTITATDACSGANINIHYLLFLDLDQDGIMETVINSVNTGIAGLGWNNVPFNNYQSPNYGGGIPRAFDERAVPFNQKYGFAIQNTTSGTKK
ncbi:MAG: proprotein convertase P-domain-containing protein, partial [Bacteroidota bacterium]